MLTSSVKVLAQSKPKAGDTISGVVTDSVSPLMAVYITELDSADRVVAYAYTDLKGEFSFSLVNPKDRIQFSYYRKEKIVLPIDKAYFLPAAGKYAFEPNNKSVGIWGHYWSSSVNRDKTSHSASVLCFSSSYYAVKIDFRNHGQSIRPVHP